MGDVQESFDYVLGRSYRKDRDDEIDYEEMLTWVSFVTREILERAERRSKENED